MIYCVRIDCWYERHGQRRREVRQVLIESDTQESARDLALAYADKTAACGDRFVGAEWRETWPVKTPADLKGRIAKSSTFRNLKFRNLEMV